MCLAIPGRLESIDDDDPLARAGRVRFGAVARRVHLALVPEARVDDYVLVHVGVAIAVVDPEEAARVFAALEQIDALELPPEDAP